MPRSSTQESYIGGEAKGDGPDGDVNISHVVLDRDTLTEATLGCIAFWLV